MASLPPEPSSPHSTPVVEGGPLRLRATCKPPCQLERSEIRRVPQDPRFGLVGYHLCCPHCGFVTVALQGQDGLAIAEHPDKDTVTFSRPVRCLFCGILVHSEGGLVRLEKDEHVRDVRYR